MKDLVRFSGRISDPELFSLFSFEINSAPGHMSIGIALAPEIGVGSDTSRWREGQPAIVGSGSSAALPFRGSNLTVH